MAKNKKKRNKPYRGADAKNRPDNVVRINAVKRNKVSQWWFENKKILKPIIITALVVLVIIFLILELIHTITM